MDSDFIKNAKTAAAKIDIFHGAPMSMLSDALRGFCVPAKGKRYIAGDFSNIEGRVLAWLAGEEWVLKAFRDFDLGIGADMYVLGYSRSFGVPIDKVDDDKRQVGKVQELSLGFQGAVGAFQNMAKNMNVFLPDAQVKTIVENWRASRPATVSYWAQLESAATGAILDVGRKFTAGAKGREVTFLVRGSFLFCQLPSKRVLCYPYPKIEEVQKPWGDYLPSVTYCYVDSISNKWLRGSTYGGSLAENVTQATARDILTEAMLRVEERGYPISMHVHDEIVSEVPENFGSVKEFEKIMSVVPEWATGLPIAVKGWEGKRYRK